MRMDAVHIEGGRKLQGEVRLSGAKNAALPMLAAACLGEEATMLDNVPVQLNDVILQIELLRAMGAEIEVEGDSVRCARGALGSRRDAPAELACKIRTSLFLLGMYAALRSEIFVAQPGGCQIGDRKYDLHLLGLRKLGAHVEEQAEGVYLKAERLRGEAIDFYLPTTTGTENVMMAAALAEGTTTLRNANTRPEVQALGNLLTAMGARVTMQSRIVSIEGAASLKGGARVAVMPGWDEAVTYIAAAGMTGGEIAIHHFDLQPIREDARYLRQAGLGLFEWQGNLYISGQGIKNPIDLFTAPYPGVNSDMQPIFAALALTLPGASTITDLRFTDRFQYVEELKRFGGDIEAFGNTAIIRGGAPLRGTTARATDLRGGMACVLAGLAAEGETRLENVYQVERGYENFVDKLNALGARIWR